MNYIFLPNESTTFHQQIYGMNSVILARLYSTANFKKTERTIFFYSKIRLQVRVRSLEILYWIHSIHSYISVQQYYNRHDHYTRSTWTVFELLELNNL